MENLFQHATAKFGILTSFTEITKTIPAPAEDFFCRQGLRYGGPHGSKFKIHFHAGVPVERDGGDLRTPFTEVILATDLNLTGIEEWLEGQKLQTSEKRNL